MSTDPMSYEAMDREPQTEARALTQMAQTLRSFAARWTGTALDGEYRAAGSVLDGLALLVADQAQKDEVSHA